VKEYWEKRRCECGRGYSVEQIPGDELEEPGCPECGGTNSELIEIKAVPLEKNQTVSVTIYECEMHKPNYTFAVVDDPWPAGCFPACPICQSEDNIYQHAIGDLTVTGILNQDEDEG
jgi:hypothetical protein